MRDLVSKTKVEGKLQKILDLNLRPPLTHVCTLTDVCMHASTLRHISRYFLT